MSSDVANICRRIQKHPSVAEVISKTNKWTAKYRTQIFTLNKQLSQN